MIQSESRLVCADNTGVKELGCIKVLGGSKRRYAYIGDVITCSVKEAIPNSKFKKGQVVKAVIVRQKYPVKRKCGSIVRFYDNAAVIVSEKDVIGTRIFGPVCINQKLRNSFPKAISLGEAV